MIDKRKLFAAVAGAIALVATGLISPSTAEAHWRGGWHRGDGGWRGGWWGGPRWHGGFYRPAVFAAAAFYPRPYFVPPPPAVLVPRPAAYVVPPPPPPALAYDYGYSPQPYRAPVKKYYRKKISQKRPCKCPQQPAAAAPPPAPEK